MRDKRNADRTAEAYLARNAVRACQVCGRLFVMRRDVVCSRACLEKQLAQAKQQAKTAAS